jgi:hypothetical protein
VAAAHSATTAMTAAARRTNGRDSGELYKGMTFIMSFSSGVRLAVGWGACSMPQAFAPTPHCR